ncbi:MAG: hypothetical protein FJ279_11995 [Planctomycetes bacterium]|nr:hypothetical protein [Planctomycetota bacterium]
MTDKVHRAAVPGKAGVWVETGFENANPQSADDIRVRRKGVVEIRQRLERGASEDYAFHLHVALANEGRAAAAARLRIRWATRRHDGCYDHMYIGYDDGREWRMLATRAARGVTDLELVVPPGRHLLCLHPKFDYGDCLEMLDRYGTHPAGRIDVAMTPEGRVVSCLRLGKRGAPRLVITTRAHPYETAGAFCMSGWMESIAGARPDGEEHHEGHEEHETILGPSASRAALDRLEIFLFPMINPDAVAAGNCCLAPTGVNFGRELFPRRGEDAGARGLADFILGLEPSFYLDMHNYTGPHLVDDFRTPDAALAEAVRPVLPDRSRDQKTWKVTVTPFHEGYLSEVCRRRFGTVPILTEFPWYLRRPEDMREHGRLFFDALLSVLAGWREGNRRQTQMDAEKRDTTKGTKSI